MIRKLNIQNIQSHKNTELEFSPGINAIVGSSNNGKSAILRALYWVRYNRPLGIDNLLSHWACDKKGNQIAPMQVTIENDSGVVTRRRTKDENQYVVNNEELNVVKTDVPSQVEQVLLLSDTNIQKQQDAPFLLSLTSGQVAQYFNKTVRLDIIDKVLSNAESKRRKTVQEITAVEELCKEYEQKKEKYSWLDSVEKLLVKYENVSQKNSELKEQCETLEQQIEQYEKISRIKEKYSFVDNARKIINKIEKQQQTAEELENKINNIECSLQEVENCKIYPSFKEQLKIINKIESLDNSYELKDKIERIEEQIANYEKWEKYIKGCKLNAIELRKQLPNICPLCGAIMKDGKCIGGKNE